jgi:hypothetical protein
MKVKMIPRVLCFVCIACLLIQNVAAAVKSKTGTINFDVDGDHQMEMNLSHLGLQVQTGIRYPWQMVRENVTLSSNMLIFIDAQNHDLVISLPNAADHSGRHYTLKKITAENRVLIAPQAGESLDGGDGIVMEPSSVDALPELQIFSDGARWYSVGKSGDLSSVKSMSHLETLEASAKIILRPSSSGNAYYLPLASEHSGTSMEMTNASSYDLELLTLSGNIDGAFQFTLPSSGSNLSVLTLMSNGSDWSIVSSQVEPKYASAQPMVLRVNTSLSAGNTFGINVFDEDTDFPIHIDWGDGTQEIRSNDVINAGGRAVIAHDFPSTDASYIITLTPMRAMHRIRFDLRYGSVGRILTEIQQWGHFVHTSLDQSFHSCSHMDISAPDLLRTSGVTMANGTFFASSNLTRAPRMDLAKVTSMNNMFANCIGLTTVENLSAPLATTATGLFDGCSQLVTAANIALGSTTAITHMFRGCSRLKTLSNVNLASVNTVASWLDDAVNLEMIDGLRLDGVTTNMNNYFNGHGTLKSVSNLYAPRVIAWYRSFMNCSTITSATNITVTDATSLADMFKTCVSLATVSLKGSSNATSFSAMFNGCSNLETVDLVVSSRAENISALFSGCSKLKTLPPMNTSQVTNMASTFFDCGSLTSMPTLDTSRVTNFYRTWRDCTALSRFPVIDMSSATSAAETFVGVTLPAGVWDAILVHLDANLGAPTGSSILHGGNSVLSMNSGVAAKISINAGGAWTVVDATP